MTPPAVLLIGAGTRRRIWFPLPVILLWPFWLLGWVVWLPARALLPRQAHLLRTVLIVSTQLSGLRMDVDTKDGPHIHLHFY
jgi:hypothetical protein